MGTRIDLNKKLQKILGSNNVYYNPDGSIKLKYPCIVYSIDYDDDMYADNSRFIKNRRYTLTLITRIADDPCIEALPDNFINCHLTRVYKVDGLHHYSFSLYY